MRPSFRKVHGTPALQSTCKATAPPCSHGGALSWSYARKLVAARSGGFDFVLDPVAEFNPLGDLGEAVLTVGFAPFLLGPEHQLCVMHSCR